MATPATPAINLDDFNCETPACANPFRFVSLFVGDSQAHYHCPACWLAWNMAIARGLEAQGLLTLEDPAPA